MPLCTGAVAAMQLTAQQDHNRGRNAFYFLRAE